MGSTLAMSTGTCAPRTSPVPRAHRPSSASGLRRAVLPLVLVVASLLGLTSLATGAVFTGADSLGSQFVAGRVSLSDGLAELPLTLGGITPGGSVVGAVHLSNSGTLAERYSIVTTADTSADEFLAAQLRLTVKTGVSTCTEAGFGASGTSLYSGPLATAADTHIIGDPAQGAQPGDRDLAAGSHEDLCMQVSLPAATDDTYENRTADVMMTFDAEQTADNP